MLILFQPLLTALVGITLAVFGGVHGVLQWPTSSTWSQVAAMSPMLFTVLVFLGCLAACVSAPRNGDVTVYLLNTTRSTQRLRIALRGAVADTAVHASALRLYCYQVTEQALARASFRLEPKLLPPSPAASEERTLSLPARSITVLSTAMRSHADPTGINAPAVTRDGRAPNKPSR